MKPTYLGDSVYVRAEGRQLIVYLDNGLGPHTIIYFEPWVYRELYKTVKREWPNLHSFATKED